MNPNEKTNSRSGSVAALLTVLVLVAIARALGWLPN